MYTQDAGVPQLPMEFFEDLTYYFDIDKHNSFFDINIMVYNNLKSYRPYNFMKGLAGAYVNSYANASEIPFNVYYFETMCNAELLLDLIVQSDYSNSLQKLCIMLGSNFIEADSVIKKYDKAFEDISDMIVEENDSILINMCSVASVFTGLWLCSKIKRKNPAVAIYNGIVI